MPTLVRDVMTTRTAEVHPMATLAEAARLMRDHDVGEVLVCYDSDLFGVITDRDLVVRGVAQGLDPAAATVGDLCTRPPVATLTPEHTAEDALALMREHAVRRLPVVERGGCPVGMVSLSRLTLFADPGTTLAAIGSTGADH